MLWLSNDEIIIVNNNNNSNNKTTMAAAAYDHPLILICERYFSFIVHLIFRVVFLRSILLHAAHTNSCVRMWNFQKNLSAVYLPNLLQMCVCEKSYARTHAHKFTWAFAGAFNQINQTKRRLNNLNICLVRIRIRVSFYLSFLLNVIFERKPKIPFSSFSFSHAEIRIKAMQLWMSKCVCVCACLCIE